MDRDDGRTPRKLLFVVAYLALWSTFGRTWRCAAACLQLCRSPQARQMRYGLACLGASWPLMGILFVVGVMSYFWIAVVALWIAAEKAFRWGGGLAAAAGVGLIGWEASACFFS